MASETMTEERCRILIMPRSHHMDEERCCRVHGVTWKLRWHRKPRVESDVEPEECPVAIADRLRAENARMRDPSAIAATIAKLTDDERREVNLALLTTGRIIMDSSAARAGYDELADRVRALGDENARLTADLESSDVANAARLSVENEALRRENAELMELLPKLRRSHSYGCIETNEWRKSGGHQFLCECGAGDHNAIIDAALSTAKEFESREAPERAWERATDAQFRADNPDATPELHRDLLVPYEPPKPAEGE